jgi:hypothetical protein
MRMINRIDLTEVNYRAADGAPAEACASDHELLERILAEWRADIERAKAVMSGTEKPPPKCCGGGVVA